MINLFRKRSLDSYLLSSIMMVSLSAVKSTGAEPMKIPAKCCGGLPFTFFDSKNRSKCKLLIFFSSICMLACLLWLQFIGNGYGYFNCGYFTKCPTFVDIEDEFSVQSNIITKDTTTCRIPPLPIMPTCLKKTWHPRPMERCDHIRPVIQRSTVNDTAHILPNVTGSCCVQEVFRGNQDNEYGLSDCQTFQSGSELPQDVEAMFVTCDGSMNAMANVPIHKAEAKLDYWESIPAEDRPISVFLFGFDSVSRPHAYRSLPKSLAVMKRLGFADFTGFHSVAPNTLSNMMAFLMGMTRPEVRAKCSKDWTAPFDNCPLIWKQFHGSNYVTGYFEDGAQSFNWGGQSGFVKRPVDYYLHPLFLALRKYRTEELGFWDLKNIDCLSRQRVPEFLLHHSHRFLNSFSSVPFFGLTWWANPFHDELYALADVDSELAQFLELVGSNTNILERVLLIYLSDHGVRFSPFGSDSLEGYIERALPPLFIRIPDKLKRSYPAMQDIVERNSAHFVTPFDLHHTMLHILSLSNHSLGKTHENAKLEQAEEFVATKSDRSSLLVNVPRNRTCTSTNIRLASCICGINYDEGSDMTERVDIVNEMVEQASLQFAIRKLNQKVQNSRYKDVCSVWYARFGDLQYLRLLSQKGSSSEVVLGFSARPGDAKFEARMSIIGFKDNTYFARLIGFARVSPYGGQSWCVGWTSDSDKEMRELCMCKVQRPSNDTSIFRFRT